MFLLLYNYVLKCKSQILNSETFIKSDYMLTYINGLRKLFPSSEAALLLPELLHVTSGFLLLCISRWKPAK